MADRFARPRAPRVANGGRACFSLSALALSISVALSSTPRLVTGDLIPAFLFPSSPNLRSIVLLFAASSMRRPAVQTPFLLSNTLSARARRASSPNAAQGAEPARGPSELARLGAYAAPSARCCTATAELLVRWALALKVPLAGPPPVNGSGSIGAGWPVGAAQVYRTELPTGAARAHH